MDMEAYKNIGTKKAVYINKLGPKKRLNLLRTDPIKYIQRIKHPTKEEQRVAIELDEKCVKYIKDIDTEVLLSAIQNNPYVMRYIKDPSPEVQLAVVKKVGFAIQYISDPSLEVQMAAVQQYGTAIACIKQPSIEVQLAAVQQYWGAIIHISDPSVEVQLAAVQQDGGAIEYIKNPIFKAKLISVKANYINMNYIKKGTDTNAEYEELTLACIAGIEAEYAAGKFDHGVPSYISDTIIDSIEYKNLSKETKMKILHLCITIKLTYGINAIFKNRYILYCDLDDDTKVLLELL